MKGKIIFAALVLSAVLAGMLAFKPVAAGAAGEAFPCTDAPHAGIMHVELPEKEMFQMEAVRFSPAFCEAPVIVATGGEGVRMVQIGVVTEQAAWLLVYAEPGSRTIVYWQALAPS